MPYIDATLAGSDVAIVQFIKDHGESVCNHVAWFFAYRLNEVTLIPRILTSQEASLSVRRAPLELRIDIGSKKSEVDDKEVTGLCNNLINQCPALADIHFKVFVRQNQINGFTEHSAEHKPA